jgi:hypothetical protein
MRRGNPQEPERRMAHESYPMTLFKCDETCVAEHATAHALLAEHGWQTAEEREGAPKEAAAEAPVSVSSGDPEPEAIEPEAVAAKPKRKGKK